ncbi:M3 family oligoendopeptidase [bacterium]|nr:M3 family oligoendopeptidase [bacterium]
MEYGFANWDLTPFFSGVDGDDFKSALAVLRLRIYENQQVTVPRLKVLCAGQSSSAELVRETAEYFLVLEKLTAELGHIVCYIECVRSEDLANEEAAQAQNEADILSSQLRKLEVALLALLKKMDDDSFALLCSRKELEKAQYCLQRLRREAQCSMETDLENLAADLAVTGFRAWENLYENLAGSLNFTYTDSLGQVHQAPMSLKVSLLENDDSEVRRSTLVNSNKAWEGVSESISACLNNISGHRLKVQEWRKCSCFLEEAAFESGLKLSTLETMMDTVAENWELPRRFLRLKAELLHLERLGFQDMTAPVSFAAGHASAADKIEKKYTWDEACRLIEAAFRSFDPEFAEFAHQALEKRWVESEVRSGKRPGGFCISSTVIGQSRIFMTFQGSLGDVFTLAHELGHAYHESLLADLRPCCHSYPMTLAETASTFAETLLGDYLLSQPGLSVNEKLSMYKRRLDDAAIYLLNIPMRFIFERSLYERRAKGENFSAKSLCRLMEEVQGRVYGDILDPKQNDPWFWASKGHFYITEVSFYNFPYTFGYLFSLGVYARFRSEGAAFRPTFNELLRLTGQAGCEECASRALNVNLQEKDFWQESLSLIETDLQQFTELLNLH